MATLSDEQLKQCTLILTPEQFKAEQERIETAKEKLLAVEKKYQKYTAVNDSDEADHLLDNL
jgi:hypothetical protein